MQILGMFWLATLVTKRETVLFVCGIEFLFLIENRLKSILICGMLIKALSQKINIIA